MSLNDFISETLTATAFYRDCETIFVATYTTRKVLEKYKIQLEKCDADLKTLVKPQAFINSY